MYMYNYVHVLFLHMFHVNHLHFAPQANGGGVVSVPGATATELSTAHISSKLAVVPSATNTIISTQ